MSETVGARLAHILAAGEVGAVFGVPGGQTLPFYAAVEDAGLQHVLMRDERAAACAADAYARLSGSVGFCDATVGPGGDEPRLRPRRGARLLDSCSRDRRRHPP